MLKRRWRPANLPFFVHLSRGNQGKSPSKFDNKLILFPWLPPDLRSHPADFGCLAGKPGSPWQHLGGSMFTANLIRLFLGKFRVI
jgi:hypothetical protein